MTKIYMDNAATSFPKPKQVTEAMVEYMENIGASLHRGDYQTTQQTEGETMLLRERLCKLFNHDEIKNAVITSGATMGCNMVLLGTLNEGDHVLVSSMEHNAVMRPLHELQKAKVSFDRIPCDGKGRMDIAAIEGMIKENTKLLIMAHASNVCGTVQDAKSVGEICKKHNLLYALDAAQTAGHLPIDFESFNLDALIVPAHKGLMGPSGIGALLLSKRLAKQIRPIITGGTGSQSDEEIQPRRMPDKLEAGTLNMAGIYGFSSALDYILKVGVEQLCEKERNLTKRFLLGLQDIKNVRQYGESDIQNRVGVAALDFLTMDNALAAQELEQAGIFTRCGLQCAPSAHKTLGTFPQGLVRFSWGAFTSTDDIDTALNAIRALTQTR